MSYYEIKTDEGKMKALENFSKESGIPVEEIEPCDIVDVVWDLDTFEVIGW